MSHCGHQAFLLMFLFWLKLSEISLPFMSAQIPSFSLWKEPEGCCLLFDGVKRGKKVKKAGWREPWERHLYCIPWLLRWWCRACQRAAGHPQEQEHWGGRGGDTDRRGRSERSAGVVGQEELFWTSWAARSPSSKAGWAAGEEVMQHELNGLTHTAGCCF